MEFADNGDLFQKITTHQKKGQLFPEEEIWNIFIQVSIFSIRFRLIFFFLDGEGS